MCGNCKTALPCVDRARDDGVSVSTEKFCKSCLVQARLAAHRETQPPILPSRSALKQIDLDAFEAIQLYDPPHEQRITEENRTTTLDVKLDIQRKYADHFRLLGFDLPVDANISKWHQPVLRCDHELCLLTLADVLRDTIDTTLDLVPSLSCTLYLYDRRSRMLNTNASSSSKRQLDVKFAPGMGIVGRCFSRKIPVHLEKPGENSLFEPKSDGRINKTAESMLCIPLVVQDKAIGLFQLVNRVVDKKDKLRDLDRYMEGFDNLHFNVAEHLGESTNENAFHGRDISTLTEYASLVAVRGAHGTAKKIVGSPRTRKLWVQTSTTLLDERTKLKNKKVTNIQKVFRGHKARAEVKDQFGVSNPAKVYRCFVKLQARFKGRLLRKLIQKHTVLQHKATKTAISAFAVVRMKCHHAEPQLQSKSYPRCHTGVNPYLVAKRGQLADVGPLFDALRLQQQHPTRHHPPLRLPTVRKPQHQSNDNETTLSLGGVDARRLVAAHALATNTPLPHLVRRSPAKSPDQPPPSRNAYHFDLEQPRQNYSAVPRACMKGPASSSPTTNQDNTVYSIQQYPQYRTTAYAVSVGAPTPPASPLRSRQPPPHRPFMCLVQRTEDAKREGIRKALEELKSYYRSRVVPGPVNRRKSIKEVMDECTSLASSRSVSILVHRVKTAPGVDFSATLLGPEIVEEPVSEMDSVDSLALEYRPVTPMLDAIQLVPPEPHFIDIPTISRLDTIFVDSNDGPS
ncbi:hypothetical protein DYB34_002577 [Aphanomyces astaci]|uniref:GAF domain-containing protein n=2 Tax=Aphanomyces astaci TaxID=112090 RepID=A0A418BX45_APHAT|nr:hypothetical protein DYB34_002577 [Aphanomyces astaci]